MGSDTAREWFQNNPRRRMTLYFDSEEQRNELEHVAKMHGYKVFSRFILDKAQLGIKGTRHDPAYVESLKQRIEDLHKAWEHERDLNEEMRGRLRMFDQLLGSKKATVVFGQDAHDAMFGESR